MLSLPVAPATWSCSTGQAVDVACPGQMTSILDAMHSAPNDGKTVYVHCSDGVGRTGAVVGCWLVRHGRMGDAALQQVAEWWQGVERVWLIPNPPETPEQKAYVRKWTESSPVG